MSRLDDIRNAAKDAEQSEPKAESNVLQGPTPNIPKAEYAAYGSPTSDPQIRVIIYAVAFFMMPRYDVMYDVFFSGNGEFVGLIFPHHRVKIFGRNLMDLVYCLRTNSVEWIREYHPTFHELPPDFDGQLPVITSIEVENVQNPFLTELEDKAQK